MTTETLDLARRAVACDGWRWVEGMKVMKVIATDDPYLDECYITLIEHGRATLNRGRTRRGIKLDRLDREYLPDLNDPATAGCLLHLVREAWGDPMAWIERTNRYYAFGGRGSGCTDRAWIVHINTSSSHTKIPGDSEIKTLVAALEEGSK